MMPVQPMPVVSNMDLDASTPEIDWEKLKKANMMLDKWLFYFDMNATTSTKPKKSMEIKNNKEKYSNMIQDEILKEQFNSDFEVMFYPQEIEETIIKKFYKIIFLIIKRTKVPYQLYDSSLSSGLLGIRNAIWKYTDHKTNSKFITYCYKITMREILRRRKKENKHYTVTIKNQNKTGRTINTFSASERKKSFEEKSGIWRSDWDVIQTKPDYEAFNIEYSLLDLEHLYKEAKLKDYEKDLMNIFISRMEDNHLEWTCECQKYYKEKFGKSVSRQAVENKVAILKIILWNVFHEKVGINFYDPKMKFIDRLIDSKYVKIELKNIMKAKKAKEIC